jgi:tRNA-(ms[2]io[6]A)-hydroxylase
MHKNPYANALRTLVRKGGNGEIIDRLLISALIEARSCERFGVLSAAAEECGDAELGGFYKRLYASEFGHFTTFLRLANKVSKSADARWGEMLENEARILAAQEPGPRIHSGS